MKTVDILKTLVFLLAILSCLSESILAQTNENSVNDLLYEIIQEKGVEAAIKHYKKLKLNKSQKYDLSENQLNILGYKLLNNNHNKEALRIFKFNADSNPGSINVWDSLGEGYLAVGDYKKAEKQYGKVLKMLSNDTTLTTQQKNFLETNAQTKLFIAKFFDPPSQETIHYVSFHGGVSAGKWDLQNVADFKKKSNLKISYEGTNLYFRPVPNNIEESLDNADIVTSFIGGDNRRFIENGLIADLSNLWLEEDWDEAFSAPFKELARYKGRQYFVPMAYQWNPIFYRKDIFEKHNLQIPESWEELLILCDKLNDLGYTPFSISVQSWPPPINRWFTILNLRLNGPDFHTKVMKGEVKFTDDRIRNVFSHWSELFDHEAFSDSSFKNNYQKGIQDFVSGKAIMYNLGEWIFESREIMQIKNKIDFFAFPKIKKDIVSAEIVHTYGAFIRKGITHQKNTKELIKWLAQKDSQQSNVIKNNRTVANLNIDQSHYSSLQKRISKYVNNVDVLVPLLEMNTHPEFAQQLISILQKYWETPDSINATIGKLEKARIEVFEE